MHNLLRIKGFPAFILIAFINAFVDLGHKIIIQNALFKIYDGDTQILLTAIVNAFVILPFVALFLPAGYFSSKYPKQKVMQISAISSVFLTIAITLCYFHGWFIAAFLLTLLMGVQSALYSPAKYGFVREVVGKQNLIPGNSWLQAITITAILSGIVIFSRLFEAFFPVHGTQTPAEAIRHVAPLGYILIAFATVEVIACRYLPTAETEEHPINWNTYQQSNKLAATLKQLKQYRSILNAILGITLFWSFSQVLIAVYPSIAETHLNMTNTYIIQGLMAHIGIGILIGALMTGYGLNRLSKRGKMTLGVITTSAALVILLYSTANTSIGTAFLLFGLGGTLTCVPLQAFIQSATPKQQLGKTIATSNLIQNFSMVIFLLVTASSALLSIDGIWLLRIITIINSIVACTLLISFFKSPKSTSWNRQNL